MTRLNITEKQFTQQVIQLLKICGFDKVYHTWNSIHSEAGFPDIVAFKGYRLLVAELKSEKGTVTKAQGEWLTCFQRITRDVYTWRPSDWEQIVKECQEAKGE